MLLKPSNNRLKKWISYIESQIKKQDIKNSEK